MGLLQKDVAAQIGVSKETIYNWEMNRTEPEVRCIAGIIEFLSYVPYDPGWTFGERVRAIRAALGFSQEQLAEGVGADESTIAKWEREEHKPTESKMRALTTFLRRQK